MPSINETLKKLRKKNGLTQRELADYLNVDAAIISNIEKGKADITLSRLELIAQKYGMSVIELLAYGRTDIIVYDKQKAEKRLHQLRSKMLELQSVVDNME